MAQKTYLHNDTWNYFWHSVCTAQELENSETGRGKLLQSKFLGVELVIAELDSGVVAMNNRCPHRSAKLYLGWNRGDSIQCAYHGWCYGEDGKCVAIPAAPEGPIPKRAVAIKYDFEVKHGLVWVRLDGSAETKFPEPQPVSIIRSPTSFSFCQITSQTNTLLGWCRTIFT